MCIRDRSYAAKLSNEAKKIKKVNSQLMNALNKIIKIIGMVILPVGIILFLKHFFWMSLPLNESVVSTVAALIGMIPEGLYLLTSIALAVGVIKLGRKSTCLLYTSRCV